MIGRVYDCSYCVIMGVEKLVCSKGSEQVRFNKFGVVRPDICNSVRFTFVVVVISNSLVRKDGSIYKITRKLLLWGRYIHSIGYIK